MKKDEQMKQDVLRSQLVNSCRIQQNLLDDVKAEVEHQQQIYK